MTILGFYHHLSHHHYCSAAPKCHDTLAQPRDGAHTIYPPISNVLGMAHGAKKTMDRPGLSSNH